MATKVNLYIGQPGTSSAAAFTAGSAERIAIDQASVCNPTGGAVTLTVYLVPSGDTAAADTTIYSAKSIASAATETLPALVNQGLDPGDSIHLKASSASSLTVCISGRSQAI